MLATLNKGMVMCKQMRRIQTCINTDCKKRVRLMLNPFFEENAHLLFVGEE